MKKVGKGHSPESIGRSSKERDSAESPCEKAAGIGKKKIEKSFLEEAKGRSEQKKKTATKNHPWERCQADQVYEHESESIPGYVGPEKKVKPIAKIV